MPSLASGLAYLKAKHCGIIQNDLNTLLEVVNSTLGDATADASEAAEVRASEAEGDGESQPSAPDVCEADADGWRVNLGDEDNSFISGSYTPINIPSSINNRGCANDDAEEERLNTIYVNIDDENTFSKISFKNELFNFEGNGNERIEFPECSTDSADCNAPKHLMGIPNIFRDISEGDVVVDLEGGGEVIAPWLSIERHATDLIRLNQMSDSLDNIFMETVSCLPALPARNGDTIIEHTEPSLDERLYDGDNLLENEYNETEKKHTLPQEGADILHEQKESGDSRTDGVCKDIETSFDSDPQSAP